MIYVKLQPDRDMIEMDIKGNNQMNLKCQKNPVYKEYIYQNAHYLPIGCVVPFPMAAATARASFSQSGIQQEGCLMWFLLAECPWIGSIALQISFPVVNVPVLSNATVPQEARASNTCPPFSNIPYKHSIIKKCHKMTERMHAGMMDCRWNSWKITYRGKIG